MAPEQQIESFASQGVVNVLEAVDDDRLVFGGVARVDLKRTKNIGCLLL